MAERPPNLTAIIDQAAAHLRDEGSAEPVTIVARDLAEFLGEVFDGLAVTAQESAEKYPLTLLRFKDVAEMLRGMADGYRGLAEQLPGGES